MSENTTVPTPSEQEGENRSETQQLLSAIRNYAEGAVNAGEWVGKQEKKAARKLIQLVLKRKPTADEVEAMLVFSSRSIEEIFE